MLEPSPLVDDGWTVIPGRLKDGTEVDLFNYMAGKEPTLSWEKPPLVSKHLKNIHWQEYFYRLNLADNAFYLRYLAYYLCYTWNRKQSTWETALYDFKIYFAVEETLPDYEVKRENVLLWEHWCYEVPEEYQAGVVNEDRLKPYVYRGNLDPLKPPGCWEDA